MTVNTLLAVFAHPDDESLVAGGTLKACSENGLTTIVICLTLGEQGSIAYPNLATRESLGTVRECELRAACEKLGVTALECFNYPDGALTWADPVEIERLLAERIKHWQPEIIITFGPEGLYWHPDHIAAHKLTKAALSSFRNEAFSPAVYYATYPEGLMTELAHELNSRGMNFDAWGLKPDAFGVPLSTITTRLDIREYLNTKIDALNCHRTQFSEHNVFITLPSDLAEKFLGWEFFVKANPSNTDQDKLAEIIGK